MTTYIPKQLGLKTACIFLCLLCSHQSSYAQDPKLYARIYIINDVITYNSRKGVLDNALDKLTARSNIFVDSTIICKLPQKSYTIKYVLPGTHLFTAQQNGKQKGKSADKPVSVNIKAGINYYFQVTQPLGVVYLVKISADFATKIIPTLKETKDCKVQPADTLEPAAADTLDLPQNK